VERELETRKGSYGTNPLSYYGWGVGRRKLEEKKRGSICGIEKGRRFNTAHRFGRGGIFQKNKDGERGHGGSRGISKGDRETLSKLLFYSLLLE